MENYSLENSAGYEEFGYRTYQTEENPKQNKTFIGGINDLTVTFDLTNYRHSKMAERLVSAMKLLCCVFVVYSMPGWRSVSGVTVRPAPAPSGIEAQAKFFQDFFSVQLSPYKIEFGHVCEDPHTWEQRYRHFPTSEDFDQGHRLGSERHFVERHEKARPAKGLYSAKVRWGDKNGGYGEHYWDLNHAGNAGSHGGDDYNDDDGSYHEDPSDGYSDHSEDSHNYEPESYASDDKPQYEESGRAKRAHSRSKVVTEQNENDDDEYEEPPRRKQRKDRKNKYHRERHEEIHEEEDSEEEEATTKSPKIKNDSDDEEVTIKPKKNKDKTKIRQSNDNERHSEQIKNIKKPEQNSETRDIDQKPQGREKNHFVLVVNQKERQEDPPKQEPTNPNRFVNYEGGSGVRQHYSSEAVPAASASRLFIEAQTGHIVDRMTGQAYVLQPLAHSNKYN